MAIVVKLGEGGDRRPVSRLEKQAGSTAQSVPVSVAITAAVAALSILGTVLWTQVGGSGHPSTAFAAAVSAEGAGISLPGPEDPVPYPAMPGLAPQDPESPYGAQTRWSVAPGVDPDPDALPSERQRGYSAPAGFDPNPDALPGEGAAGR